MTMTMTISVTEARASLSEIVRRVLAGEEVTLTRHGEAVAIVLRPDALRARHTTRAVQMADELHDLLERARHEPIDRTIGFTVAEAEALVAEVYAGREDR